MAEDMILDQEMQSVDQIIDNMSLMDDDLFGLVFNNNIPAAEVLLKTILKRDDIEIISVEGQKELRNPEVGGRMIRLDVLVKDGTGRFYNVEVQRTNSGAHPKRARFHSSMVDARMLKEGQKFKELKESYVIFITENDYWGEELPIYTINRHFEEVDRVFEDESHIIYVNGSYKGNDAIGHLMQDFRCKKADDIQNAELAKGVRYFKENEGGRQEMCESVERYGDQRAIKATIETSIELGANKEKVVDILRKRFALSEEQAERVYERYAPAVV
ncbi:MAG: PD-(D/E)XK nuclease family transposase [Clostridiales bacterium]|nr:PD-(D/E)XK nuclease family transposase [Clostridiales bacterium]